MFALTALAATVAVANIRASGAAPSVNSGWTRLPDPPFAWSKTTGVWTGRALIAWGGYELGDSFPGDGALYDVRPRRWHRIPSAPIADRTGPAAVWTGTELLVWGGWGRRARVLGDGAAFNPSHGTWRRLPTAPLSARAPAAWTWTGKELIVWGDASRRRTARDGAAYNPVANTWRRLPYAPRALNEVSTVWVGGEMIVYGAKLNSNNVSRSGYARGLAYTPATDHWRILPPFPLSPQASTVAALGRNAVVWDYLLAAALYEPRRDRWTRLPKLPLDPAECYPTTAKVGRFVLGWYCGLGALFDPSTRAWRRILRPRPGLVLEEPIGAGPIALFLGNRTGAEHTQLWALRPSAAG